VISVCSTSCLELLLLEVIAGSETGIWLIESREARVWEGTVENNAEQAESAHLTLARLDLRPLPNRDNIAIVVIVTATCLSS